MIYKRSSPIPVETPPRRLGRRARKPRGKESLRSPRRQQFDSLANHERHLKLLQAGDSSKRRDMFVIQSLPFVT
jgi:hypothetical protein